MRIESKQNDIIVNQIRKDSFKKRRHFKHIANQATFIYIVFSFSTLYLEITSYNNTFTDKHIKAYSVDWFFICYIFHSLIFIVKFVNLCDILIKPNATFLVISINLE